MRYPCFVCTMLLLAIGCNSQPNPPKPNSKVNVTAPGVNVEVEKKKGNVEVQAPGVDIKVNPK